MIIKRKLLNFIKSSYRTKEELRNPSNEKDIMRYDLARQVLERNKGKEINILTLPCVWWNFEKLLSWLAPKWDVRIRFTGCEWDTDTFLASTERLPRGNTIVVNPIFYNKETNLTFAISDCASLFNIDIFSFMQDFDIEKGVQYDFVWLDLMCHVTSFHTRLPLVNRVLKPGGMVTITYAVGREKHPIKRSREAMIQKVLPNFKVDSLGKYRDTYAMRYITLIKEET